MRYAAMVIFLIFVFAGGQGVVLAEDIEWQSVNEFKLEAKPLAVTSSPDGSMLYFLLPGKILVYEQAGKKMLGSIRYTGNYTGLTAINDGRDLVLTGGEQVKILHYEIRKDIDISGLPVEGSLQAPVTIVVFSGYQ